MISYIPLSSVFVLLLMMLASSISGCTSANYDSIFHEFDASEHSNSVTIDAKQRAILVSHPPSYNDSNGNLYQPPPIICTEPSPDALSVLSSAFSGKLDVQAKIAAQLMTQSEETGANIGIRTQTITILRDAMYRLCEGYMSGALTPVAFERLQRRYQNAMVGLLAVEQLTNVVSANQKIIGGNQNKLPPSDGADSKDSSSKDSSTPQSKKSDIGSFGNFQSSCRLDG